MKSKFGRSALKWVLPLCLGLAGIVNAQTVPLAKQRIITVGDKSYMLKSRLKAILVGNFTYGFNHTVGYPNLEATLKRLGAAEGWTVDVTDPKNNGSEVTAANLAKYQVFFANFISYWAQSGKFPAAGKAAVQDFVEVQGNGVFIMHSSGDSGPSQNWPWFYDVAHPEYNGESSRLTVSAPVAIPVAAKTHPVMEGINFGGKDTVIFPQGEWHTFQKMITAVYPKADVFLRMNGAKCTKDGSGTNCGSGYNYSVPGGYPAAWTFPDKKGNIGYFMEGHDLVTMQAMTQPIWDRFFKQFMYYTAGYDTTLVGTGIVRKDASEPMGVDASGITFHPSDRAGVFISKPGYHVISLFDMKGHKIKEIRGSESPADFDLSPALQGAKSGVYAIRVSLGKESRTGRFLVR